MCDYWVLISDGKSERVALLTDKCQEYIAIGIEVLDRTIQQLLTGQISVAKLKLLTAGTGNFVEVFRIVEKNAQSDMFSVPESGLKEVDKTMVLQKLIAWRKMETQSLELMCRNLSYFVAACRDIQSGWLWIVLSNY